MPARHPGACRRRSRPWRSGQRRSPPDEGARGLVNLERRSCVCHLRLISEGTLAPDGRPSATRRANVGPDLHGVLRSDSAQWSGPRVSRPAQDAPPEGWSDRVRAAKPPDQQSPSTEENSAATSVPCALEPTPHGVFRASYLDALGTGRTTWMERREDGDSGQIAIAGPLLPERPTRPTGAQRSVCRRPPSSTTFRGLGAWRALSASSAGRTGVVQCAGGTTQVLEHDRGRRTGIVVLGSDYADAAANGAVNNIDHM